jgi:hypothetical protein
VIDGQRPAPAMKPRPAPASRLAFALASLCPASVTHAAAPAMASTDSMRIATVESPDAAIQ